MERPYYSLKALFVGVALIAGAYCSYMGCERFVLAGNPNYQAAALAEAQVRDVGLKLARNIGHLLGRPLAYL